MIKIQYIQNISKLDDKKRYIRNNIEDVFYILFFDRLAEIRQMKLHV